MALTFRKTFDSSNKRSVQQLLKDIIHSMRPVIEEETRANSEAFKRCLSLNMNFCKSTSPGIKTDPTDMFHLEVFMSIDTDKRDYQFHVGYNQIVEHIHEFQSKASAGVVDHHSVS